MAVYGFILLCILSMVTNHQSFQKINPFLPTVPTFAVCETHVSRHNLGTGGAPIMPKDSLGQQMLERWA